MVTKKKMTIPFYQNLGKLFYAIAVIDGNVNPVEVDKLKKVVKEQWLVIDDLEDAFGSDAAYQIEIVFDWLNEQANLNAEDCFNDFVGYKKRQSHLFTKENRNLILKTATKIAYAFSKINKSELRLLTKLHMQLKQ